MPPESFYCFTFPFILIVSISCIALGLGLFLGGLIKNYLNRKNLEIAIKEVSESVRVPAFVNQNRPQGINDEYFRLEFEV